MAITVKHSKVSTIPDDADTSLVRPSDWNADHALTGVIDVANGGTGASTLTGYVKGNGTSAMTAAATVPSTDITGLGTISTQNANAVAITGGTINGTTIGATTAVAGSFTDLSVTGTTSFDGSQGTAGQVLTSAGAGNTPTWATPSGSGTVTSITAGSGLSGGTITTSGTIALDINGLTSTTVASTDLVPVYDVSAAANADCLASDIAGLGVGAIGYANNRFYFPYLMVSAGATGIQTTNQINYVPFFVRKKTTFTRIGIGVTVGVGTSARLGIYNAANGVPTSLLLDCGTVSIASGGDKDATINQSLNVGFYFLAIVCDAATTINTCGVTASSSSYSIGQLTRASTTNYYYFAANGSITLPNPAQTSLSESNTGVPAISLRVV